VLGERVRVNAQRAHHHRSRRPQQSRKRKRRRLLGCGCHPRAQATCSPTPPRAQSACRCPWRRRAFPWKSWVACSYCNMARSQQIELKLGQALRVCSHLDGLGSCGARATGSKDCGPNWWVGKIGTFRPPWGPFRPTDWQGTSSGFYWIPPVVRRLFEVNSEPHIGARPSIRLCVGLKIQRRSSNGKSERRHLCWHPAAQLKPNPDSFVSFGRVY
jgi:hypothetical protein